MTDQIHPALTKEEWEQHSFRDSTNVQVVIGSNEYEGTYVEIGDEIVVTPDIPRVMAFLNAALPDSDPRKITWQAIADIREGAFGIDMNHGERCTGKCDCGEIMDRLSRFADALESYLPPETT